VRESKQTSKTKRSPKHKSGAGSGILALFKLRARDFWTWAFGHHLCSPDYESGALARLGYPGKLPLFFMADVMLVCFP